MRHLAALLVVLCIFTNTSCEIDELPKEPYREEATEDDTFATMQRQIQLGANYGEQVWYNLERNEVVARANLYGWDLAFDCRDTIHAIYLNTGIAMKAAITQSTDFTAEPKVEQLSFTHDHSSGFLDSIALRHLVRSGKVAVIDRGVNLDGDPQGYLKIQATWQQDAGLYKLKYASLDNDQQRTVNIHKRDGYNKSYFSFEWGTERQIAPPRQDFDVVFTKYTFQFHEPYVAYLVTGVLLNPYKTQALAMDDTDFESVELADVSVEQLSRHRDVIGYDWKYYDLDEGIYAVNDRKVFIVQTQNDQLYKWHFKGFYDENGVKGAPLFRTKRLQ